MTGHCGPAGQNRPALKIIDSYWQSIALFTLVPAPIADVTQATSFSYSGVAGDWPRPCLGVAKGEGLGDRNLRERVTRSGCGARSSPGVPFRVAHLPSSALAPWLCSSFSCPFWCRVSSWEALRETRGRGDPGRARLLAGARSGGGLGLAALFRILDLDLVLAERPCGLWSRAGPPGGLWSGHQPFGERRVASWDPVLPFA